MHKTTHHYYILEIPSLHTFQAPDQYHKFNIVDFSEKYQGIVGTKLLKQMEAIINLRDGFLETSFTKIPLHFDNPRIILEPRQRKIIKLPVDRNFQEIYINHQEIAPGVEIPENITIAKDYQAITEVTNFNDYPMEIAFDKPINTTVYEEISDERNHFRIPPNIVRRIQRENIESKLRLNHLNSEEKKMIKNLCLEYKDLVHDERLPLTFTSKI